MRKIIVCVTIAVMILSLAACGNGQNGQNKITNQKPLVVLVTNTGTMGDKSFNDAGWSGCEKAKEDNDIDIRCLETENSDELEANLQSAGNDGAKLAVVMGSGNKETIDREAKNYPDTDFLIVDGKKSGDNVAGITFREEQGAFLAGIAAASTTKTKTVGFIGGEKTDSVIAYECGFKAGVETLDQDIEVLTKYAGTFSDAAKGKKIAAAMNKSGADVIMQAAGNTGGGVIEAAGEKGFYAIGSDVDQSVMDSEHVLCSAVKGISSAVEEEIDKTCKGDFKAENIVGSVEDDQVGISDNAGNLPDALMERLNKIKKQIEKKNSQYRITLKRWKNSRYRK